MRLIDADSVQVELECAPFYKCNSGIMRQLRNGLNKPVTFSEKETLLKWKDILAVLDEAPTIEAEPVRHGRWKWYEEWGPSTWLEPPDIINAGWKCTECGIDLGEYLTAKLHEEVYVGDMDKMPEVDRCPHCGAKMDAKEEPHEAPRP